MFTELTWTSASLIVGIKAFPTMPDIVYFLIQIQVHMALLSGQGILLLPSSTRVVLQLFREQDSHFWHDPLLFLLEGVSPPVVINHVYDIYED